jgi:1-deoxy-D-xylulose-5-phosphate synthase
MTENPKLVIITAAMPEGNRLRMVADEFPERVFDVGICEQHAVTFAAGLATQGYIPIVAIYSTFLQRALDQIIHDVSLQNLPVIFAIDRGGIVGDDGKTHQGTFDLSYLSPVPHLVVSAPKDENELRHLLYTAVTAGRVMAIRYPRGPGLGVEQEDALYPIPIGKWELLQPGKDVAILATGSTVSPALEAAHILAGQKVDAAVVNARFIKPLDAEMVRELSKMAKTFVTVEENTLHGGLGSAVARLLQDMELPRISLHCIGLPDEFVEQGTQAVLRARYGLDAQGIASAVLRLFPDREAGFIATEQHAGTALPQ